jgi:hypothetical protein
MFWIFNDGPGCFWLLWDSWDGRDRLGSQPGHLFVGGGLTSMQPI